MTHPDDGAQRGATAASEPGPEAADPAGRNSPAADPAPGTAGSGATAPGATMPGGRRRRRRLPTPVLVACVAIGVALLLWAVDQGARIGAESLIARQVQSATGVPARPDVQLHGTFFLPQVVSGRYSDVEITLHDLSAGPLRIATVHADLRGVHVPFHDVLVRAIGPIPIEQSQEDAFLTYADLNRYLAATGRPVKIQFAPGGQAELTGTVRVLGHDVSASTRARLSTRNGALLVSPTQLDTQTPLDAASKLLLGQRFSFTVPLDPLPFGQELTSVAPQRNGILVKAKGSGIVVRP